MRQGKGNYPDSTCIANEGQRGYTLENREEKNKSRLTLKWAVRFIQIEIQPCVLPLPVDFHLKILQYIPQNQHFSNDKRSSNFQVDPPI